MPIKLIIIIMIINIGCAKNDQEKKYGLLLTSVTPTRTIKAQIQNYINTYGQKKSNKVYFIWVVENDGFKKIFLKINQLYSISEVYKTLPCNYFEIDGNLVLIGTPIQNFALLSSKPLLENLNKYDLEGEMEENWEYNANATDNSDVLPPTMNIIIEFDKIKSISFGDTLIFSMMQSESIKDKPLRP